MKGDWHLAMRFAEAHPPDVALVLAGLSPARAAVFFDRAPAALVAEVLKVMDRRAAAECLAQLDAAKVGAVMCHFDSARAAALLRNVHADFRNAIVAQLPGESKKAVVSSMRYVEGTVGSVMNTAIFIIPQHLTVRDAVALVRKNRKQITTYVYVADAEGTFVGVLRFRDLVLGDAATPVSAVMRRGVSHLMPRTRLHTVAKLPAWNQYLALPVVDRGGALLGELQLAAVRAAQPVPAAPAMSSAGGGVGKPLLELYTMGARLLLHEFFPPPDLRDGDQRVGWPAGMRRNREERSGS